ncbi:unnamed protein product [Heligmosomoides polygyrus]|uniref:Uncharacterized protein n=1 Tax=Heligmosomoides polygyrus TaxID=6339 RepID=A0A183GG27_HELPZ|nr:unnamed protein product [Heligmosomoides polygyrus]
MNGDRLTCVGIQKTYARESRFKRQSLASSSTVRRDSGDVLKTSFNVPRDVEDALKTSSNLHGPVSARTWLTLHVEFDTMRLIRRRFWIEITRGRPDSSPVLLHDPEITGPNIVEVAKNPEGGDCLHAKDLCCHIDDVDPEERVKSCNGFYSSPRNVRNAVRMNLLEKAIGNCLSEIPSCPFPTG